MLNLLKLWFKSLIPLNGAIELVNFVFDVHNDLWVSCDCFIKMRSCVKTWLTQVDKSSESIDTFDVCVTWICYFFSCLLVFYR